jgi:hypothetical protein
MSTCVIRDKNIMSLPLLVLSLPLGTGVIL